MALNVNNNVNSAILSGAFASGRKGLENASDGITQASISIAQHTNQSKDRLELLSDVASDQVGHFRKLLPSNAGGDKLTHDLMSLTINSRNAQASSKVLEVVKNTVGRLIDETA